MVYFLTYQIPFYVDLSKTIFYTFILRTPLKLVLKIIFSFYNVKKLKLAFLVFDIRLIHSLQYKKEPCIQVSATEA